ncbi:MAG TPA: hypothetical protein VGI93_04055 [Steroidobacteraceae bacterium]|jgi:hypothetical protein
MEIGPAKQTNGFSALAAALCKSILLITLAYAGSLLVPASLSVVSWQVNGSAPANEDLRRSASVQKIDTAFSGEICGTALPELGRHSRCNSPK